MATTSAAVLQSLGTPFLSGAKSGRGLLSPAGVVSGGKSARRLVVAAAAAAPKLSWIPAVRGGGNLIDPEWLDGSVERGAVVRGRGGAGGGGALLVRDAAGDHAALLLMGYGWRASGGWTSSTRTPSRWRTWATPGRAPPRTSPTPPATTRATYPVGKFFDPLSVAGAIRDGVYVPDAGKLERLKLAEIKHARIAMLAMLIFYFEAGQGKTPLAAIGL